MQPRSIPSIAPEVCRGLPNRTAGGWPGHTWPRSFPYVAGRIAFIHRQQAHVAGDQRPCGTQAPRIHLRLPPRPIRNLQQISPYLLAFCLCSKHAGSTADEFADLAVDAQGNWRRSTIATADRERLARQPQIE